MTSMVKLEGRRIINVSPWKATLAGFLAIAAFALTAEPIHDTLTVAPEIAFAQDASAAFQFVIATATSTPTATMTIAPTPSFTPTKRPTNTVAPTRRPTTVPTLEKPKPLPTKTPAAKPAIQLDKFDGTSPDNAPHMETGVRYVVPAGQKRFVEIGVLGNKIRITDITSTGNPSQVDIAMYDIGGPEDKKQMTQWLVGLADPPPVKGRLIWDGSKERWQNYDGKSGPAIFLGIIRNLGGQEFSLTAKVNDIPAVCAQPGNPGGLPMGQYQENLPNQPQGAAPITWRTCNPDWLGSNGK